MLYGLLVGSNRPPILRLRRRIPWWHRMHCAYIKVWRAIKPGSIDRRPAAYSIPVKDESSVANAGHIRR